MSPLPCVFRRELAGYFRTPVGYVFLAGFLLAVGIHTWFADNFFDANQASLTVFFSRLPWFFLVFAPLVGMRLWSEEKRSGTWELLLTLPVGPGQAVIGKFLAAWAFMGLALLLTFPLPCSLAYLGSPEWGPVVTGYLGSWLLAGVMIAISALASALTSNQIVAFILGLVSCLALQLLGWSAFGGLLLSAGLPVGLVDGLANLGFQSFHEPWTRGLPSLTSLAHPLILMGASIALAVTVIERQPAPPVRRGHKAIAAALIVASTACAAYIATFLPGRWDATDSRTYSLSDGSRRLAAGFEHPVQATFYFTRSNEGLPTYVKNYADRIIGILREYERASGGRIALSIVDPRPDTAEEETARAAGLMPQGLQSGETLYLGLRATLAERELVIPFLDPAREPFLEYDISSLLHRLGQERLPVLGILAGLPVLGSAEGAPTPQGQQPLQEWLSMTELRTSYELRPVADAIDPDVDALLVVHPGELAPSLQYQLDQFILSGRPVMALVDPSNITARRDINAMAFSMPGGSVSVSSELPLLARYGISFDKRFAVSDTKSATIVAAPGQRKMPNPTWLTLSDGFDASNPVTARLGNMLLVEAGRLSLDHGATLRMEPLLESTTESALLPVSSLNTRTPAQLQLETRPDGRRYTLAARFTGPLKSAFPDGPPKGTATLAPATTAPGATAQATGLVRSKGDVHLVVVCDADFLSDAYAATRSESYGMPVIEPINDNIAFFRNALEILCGDPALASARAKTSSIRPFTRVEGMHRDAERDYMDRLRVREERLKRVRDEIARLQGPAGGTAERPMLTPEVARTLAGFREQELKLRRELRELNKELREEIEALDLRLSLLNSLLMPLLVALAGTVHSWRRSRRHKPAA